MPFSTSIFSVVATMCYCFTRLQALPVIHHFWHPGVQRLSKNNSSTSGSSNQNPDDPSKPPDTGSTGSPPIAVIAGGAVGAVVALALLAFLIWFIRRRQQQKGARGDGSPRPQEMDGHPTRPRELDDGHRAIELDAEKNYHEMASDDHSVVRHELDNHIEHAKLLDSQSPPEPGKDNEHRRPHGEHLGVPAPPPVMFEFESTEVTRPLTPPPK